jgi:hypothetical protein
MTASTGKHSQREWGLRFAEAREAMQTFTEPKTVVVTL